MKKEEKAVLILCAIIFIAGIFLRHFWGGVLVGLGAFGLITITIGRWQVSRLQKKVDKQMRDFVINQQKK